MGFMYPTHVPTLHHPMYARAHRRACSPCVGFNPFTLLAFMIFAPMLFRLALFVFFHVVAPIALAFGAAALLSSFVGACEDDTSTTCSTSHNAGPYPEMMKACFAKMKAESSKERGCRSTHARASQMAGTTDTKSTGPRRFDLSSVSLATTADGVTVTVATPGVKEVEVTVVEQTLRVKGETTLNGDTFCVDQTILIPSGLDLDSAKATHENGEAVVTVRRTAGKRIMVNAVKKDNSESKEAEAEKNEGGSSSADGEWEPLNTE